MSDISSCTLKGSAPLALVLVLQGCSSDFADDAVVVGTHEAVVFGSNDLTEVAAVADPRLPRPPSAKPDKSCSRAPRLRG